VKNSLFKRCLGLATVSAMALSAAVAEANSTFRWMPVIDMTTSLDPGADMVVTTGFLHELDFVSPEVPRLSVAADSVDSEDRDAEKSGWSGVVEVDVDRQPALPDNLSPFSDVFAENDTETRMSGFYTMRYQFETDLPFRPYAGAGLGVVATAADSAASGVVAGRATAGFDYTVSEGSAVFAEYALVKSGGVNIGAQGNGALATDTIPDIEHSLKIGFRRTF